MPKLKKDKKHSHIASRKKTLKSIPDFKNLDEEANFWDTHDTTEYAWEDLSETIEVAGQLKASVEKRRAERLAALLKLEPKHLRATQRIARRKGVTSDVLIKTWIDEGLRRESVRIWVCFMKIAHVAEMTTRFRVYLFGGVAKSRNGPLSDVNVAVYFSSEGDARYRFRRQIQLTSNWSGRC